MVKNFSNKQYALLVALFLGSILIIWYFVQPKQKEIVVINLEEIRQEFYYKIAQDPTLQQAEFQKQVDKMARDFEKFTKLIDQIAEQKGYIVLDGAVVLGGATDITEQGKQLFADVRRGDVE